MTTDDTPAPVLEPDAPDEASDAPGPDEPATADEEQGTDDPASDDATDPARRVRAEARNLRARVRSLEAERDQLARAVEHYRRAAVEQHAAAAGLAAPSDVWLAPGVELAALLADDGATVDAAKVKALVDELLRERPHWRRGPRADPSQGSTSRDNIGGAGRTWEALVRGTVMAPPTLGHRPLPPVIF